MKYCTDLSGVFQHVSGVLRVRRPRGPVTAAEGEKDDCVVVDWVTSVCIYVCVCTTSVLMRTTCS